MSKKDDFEEAERLASKSKLTEKDVEWFSKQVAKGMAKHVKKLLKESKK